MNSSSATLTRQPGTLLSSEILILSRVLTLTTLCVSSFESVSEKDFRSIWSAVNSGGGPRKPWFAYSILVYFLIYYVRPCSSYSLPNFYELNTSKRLLCCKCVISEFCYQAPFFSLKLQSSRKLFSGYRFFAFAISQKLRKKSSNSVFDNLLCLN